MAYSRPAEILLINHAASDIALVKSALKAQARQSHLHVAENGMEALDFLFKRGKHTEARRPDLILLSLTGQDARETLADAKASATLCDIPIIAITGAAKPADIVDTWNLHANCYIVRPEDREEYTAMLQSILRFWLSIVRLPSMH